MKFPRHASTLITHELCELHCIVFVTLYLWYDMFLWYSDIWLSEKSKSHWDHNNYIIWLQTQDRAKKCPTLWLKRSSHSRWCACFCLTSHILYLGIKGCVGSYLPIRVSLQAPQSVKEKSSAKEQAAHIDFSFPWNSFWSKKAGELVGFHLMETPFSLWAPLGCPLAQGKKVGVVLSTRFV